MFASTHVYFQIVRFMEVFLSSDRFVLRPRSLDNFPSDQEVQQLGCQVLRRVYIRARENTIMGSRVVTLGKQMDEVRHLTTNHKNTMKYVDRDAGKGLGKGLVR